MHLKKLDLVSLNVVIQSEIEIDALIDAVILIHADSIPDYQIIVAQLMTNKNVYVGIASDVPNMHHFLGLNSFNIGCYFNSYMVNTHYKQMIEMVLAGQKWIVPEVLSKTLKFAMKAEEMESYSFKNSEEYKSFTPKERLIASDIGDCLSNSEIALKQNITERTVKAHLTKIYKKANVKDRLGLSAKFNN